MTCFYPQEYYKTIDGRLTKNKRKAVSHMHKVTIPCRGCIGCRMDHETTWMVRNLKEAQLHKSSRCLTLTYSDKHVPRDYSLSRRAMQLFMKRLRKRFADSKLRFFLVGEYGSKTDRPHYHALIYGLPSDGEYKWSSVEGRNYYRSSEVEKAWQEQGHVLIGDVTPQSAAYVSGYLLKNSDGWNKNYEFSHLETGELIERQAPFMACSNRPGIGRDWALRYSEEIFTHDSVPYIKGGNMRFAATPEYFLKALERDNADDVEAIRKARRLRSKERQALLEKRPERLAVREECLKDRIGRSNRSL